MIAHAEGLRGFYVGGLVTAIHDGIASGGFFAACEWLDPARGGRAKQDGTRRSGVLTTTGSDRLCAATSATRRRHVHTCADSGGVHGAPPVGGSPACASAVSWDGQVGDRTHFAGWRDRRRGQCVRTVPVSLSNSSHTVAWPPTRRPVECSGACPRFRAPSRGPLVSKR